METPGEGKPVRCLDMRWGSREAISGWGEQPALRPGTVRRAGTAPRGGDDSAGGDAYVLFVEQK